MRLLLDSEIYFGHWKCPNGAPLQGQGPLPQGRVGPRIRDPFGGMNSFTMKVIRDPFDSSSILLAELLHPVAHFL